MNLIAVPTPRRSEFAFTKGILRCQVLTIHVADHEPVAPSGGGGPHQSPRQCPGAGTPQVQHTAPFLTLPGAFGLLTVPAVYSESKQWKAHALALMRHIACTREAAVENVSLGRCG